MNPPLKREGKVGSAAAMLAHVPNTDLARFAELVIGRRFAPARWLATFPFQGEDLFMRQASRGHLGN
jgi:hypothetical protein